MGERKQKKGIQQAERQPTAGSLGIASEWRTVTAEEFCRSVRDGTHDSPKPVEHGRFLVTSRHIIGGQLDLGDAYLISQADFDEINKRSKVDQWDVLVSMIGTVGEPCLIKENPNFAIKNIGLFKSKSELEGKWLYYYLRSPGAQQTIRELSRGTTQQYIPLGALREFPIFAPNDRDEMRAIANILSTLDDKIELNRKMNETLEAIARALFKSWFVDFDPVRAKAEGRAPSLPASIAALFPDFFEDSELGEIPKGWTAKTLDEEFEITMGQSPPGDTYNETGNGIPFFQGCTDFGFRYPRRRIYCTAPTRFAEESDTLVSVRAPVGDVNMANSRCCIGRGVAAVRHASRSRSYTYYTMQSLRQVFDKFEGEGTVFGSINKKDFHAIRRPVPPKGTIAAFERIADPLDSRIASSLAESESLIALRDTLLPKLLSGQLRVDAESA